MANGFELTNGRCLQRRITGGSAATLTRIQDQIFNRYPRASQFDTMRNRLEHGPGLHDSVHCIVGGTMCSARSSNDPVFFSHHANTDRVWWVWQNEVDGGLTAYRGNTDLNEIMPVSPYTPRQVLNLMAQGLNENIAVNYWTDEAYDRLERLVREMTPDELALIPTAGTEVTNDVFFFDMNMDVEQIELIQSAEILQQQSDINEAVALTLENVIDRGFGSPNLDQAIRIVTTRLQAARLNGNGDEEVSAEELWLALARTMVHNNVVPRFSQLQEILKFDENGETEDIDVVVVPIPCAVEDIPVCADGNLFPSPCEAEQGGYNSWTMGACPTVDLDPPLDEDADGGDSAEYNHEMQELAECPELVPARASLCSVEGTVCYYGAQCCNVFRTVVTCHSTRGWHVVTQPWTSCDEVNCPGDENIPTRTPTPRPTRRPTPPPTQRPTRSPTLLPTSSPTRRNTIPTPTRRPTRGDGNPHPGGPTKPDPIPGGPTPPPPTPPNPCPRINFLQCQQIRCCAPGSTLVDRPVINGSNQNCPACMVRGRRTLAPTCCRGPEVACAQIQCPSPQTAVLVQPQGENGRAPCCPRYRCGCPPQLVCSLENIICAADQIARWTLDGAMDSTGCCRNAECLTPVCATELRIVCDDGTVNEPVWENGCRVEPCPLVCPDEGMRTCPVSRSTAPSGQIPRGRGDPFIRDGSVVCLWQDCPPYEPCDDTQYTLEERHCHHNGECVRGLEAFRCQCDDNHEGQFCATRKTLPRVVVPLRDRSGAFIDSQCIVILCQINEFDIGECFGTGALDESTSNTEGSSIEMYSISDMVSNVDANILVRPVQFVGLHGEDLWFLNSDGNPIKMNINYYLWFLNSDDLAGNSVVTDSTMIYSDENTDNEYNTIINADLSGDRFQVESVTEYSYRTATAEPPQVSEWRFVQKSEISSTCSVWTYFTDTAIGFYWSEFFHSVPWGPERMHQEKITTQIGDHEVDILSSTTSVEVCENKCLTTDENGESVLELCNRNGICNPDTGECMCDFGFIGEKCDRTDETE